MMTHLLAQSLGIRPTPQRVQEVIHSEIKEFLQKHVNPGSTVRDEERTCVSREIFQESARLGLLNWLIPIDAHGLGGSRRTFGLLLEQIGYYSEEMAFASLLAMFADMPNVIYQTGRKDLIEKYIIPMSRGERFSTFAFTDYGDPLSFETRVKKIGDCYILQGEKCLQTGGSLADTFITYVRDESDDLKIFIVEREDKGVLLESVSTMGLRSAGLTRLQLQEVELSEDRLLCPSDGLGHAQMFLNDRRIFIVSPFVGAMKAILEKCIFHLKTVIREGKPLTAMQAVQAKIGSMSIKYETARAVLHDALNRLEDKTTNPLFDPVISSAKYYIAESAIAVADQAMRLTGWRGYSKLLPFESYLRAFMAAVTGQTAQDILEIQLGINAIAQVELNQLQQGG